jgi:hypothetical protein
MIDTFNKQILLRPARRPTCGTRATAGRTENNQPPINTPWIGGIHSPLPVKRMIEFNQSNSQRQASSSSFQTLDGKLDVYFQPI